MSLILEKLSPGLSHSSLILIRWCLIPYFQLINDIYFYSIWPKRCNLQKKKKIQLFHTIINISNFFNNLWWHTEVSFNGIDGFYKESGCLWWEKLFWINVLGVKKQLHWKVLWGTQNGSDMPSLQKPPFWPLFFRVYKFILVERDERRM